MENFQIIKNDSTYTYAHEAKDEQTGVHEGSKKVS